MFLRKNLAVIMIWLSLNLTGMSWPTQISDQYVYPCKQFNISLLVLLHIKQKKNNFFRRWKQTLWKMLENYSLNQNILRSYLYPTYTPMNNFFTLWQHFWDTKYKNIFLFFALIKKMFLQNLVEIMFRYHKKYF